MNLELALQTGIDIPFTTARAAIHQPKIKEIAFIGEENFFIGCELLRFSKNKLSSQDRINLENQDDFEIILSVMNNKNDVGAKRSSTSAKLVLLLMFPNCRIKSSRKEILIFNENNEQLLTIDKNSYKEFKEILLQMFCLKKEEDAEYKPLNSAAQRIADKLKKGKQRAAAQKGGEKRPSVLSKYISILTVGEHKNMNDLTELTIYQLYDEFNRFQMKENSDMYFKAKIAGATGMKEVDNWMKDIHEEEEFT